MNLYTVTRKSDGVKVYEYSADSKSVWDQFPESDYDYALIENAPIAPGTPPKYNGKRDLSHLEFRSLFTQEEIEGIDEFQATFETQAIFDRSTKNRIRTAYITYSTAEFVNLDDPSTALGLGVYAAIGLIAPQRISEVLNG